jgi:phosphohistidine phosphatase
MAAPDLPHAAGAGTDPEIRTTESQRLMEIYLLRHGIAENARPGVKDADRELTSEGRQKLQRVLKRAKNADVDPDVILSSPYRRAVETAEIAASTLGYRGKIVETKALVPNAGPKEAWDEIRARKTENSILLASHEPLMSAMTAFLLGCPTLVVDMKKAALVRVDCESLGAEPRGILKWMLTPPTADE